MPADNSRSLSGLFILCLLLATSLPASADRIVNVTGFGYLGGGSEGLGVNTGFFFAQSAWPDGPSILGFGTVGVPISLSFSSVANPGPGFTSVFLGNFYTDILFGSIMFNGTFTVPASALTTGVFMAPMAVSGDVQAYQDLTLGQGYYTPGAQIADLAFGGKGIVTLDIQPNGDGSFIIVDATVNFTNRGTLSAAVPEPASLLLFGTGLAGLALALKVRRNLRHPVR